jgi:predicted lysophospholipase L1 biosynthesis ABC-type transport system permease subunit
MRQPTATQSAFRAPKIPVVLKNGEKANDNKVGAKVLLITEQIPNTRPRIAPAAGPKSIAPIITGMCTVVAFTIGSCIIPLGVLANTTTIAAMSATSDIQRRSFFLFLKVISFPLFPALGGEMHYDFTGFSSSIFAVARLRRCNAI